MKGFFETPYSTKKSPHGARPQGLGLCRRVLASDDDDANQTGFDVGVRFHGESSWVYVNEGVYVESVGVSLREGRRGKRARFWRWF